MFRFIFILLLLGLPAASIAGSPFTAILAYYNAASGGAPGAPEDQFSANPIFSVGVTATELDNEGTITVASNIATFSVAFPTNVGVGDVVQYDVDNDADIEAGEYGIIHGISTDRTKAYLLTTAGAGVTNTSASTSVYDIFRAYTSLSDAEASTENTNVDADIDYGLTDFVLTDEDDEDGPLYYACYADGVDALAVMDGYTTDADDFIKIFTPTSTAEVGTSQRHNGITGGYTMDTSSGDTLTLSDDYMYVEGLNVENSSDLTGDHCIVVVGPGASNFISITHNIAKLDTDIAGNGIYLNDSDLVAEVINNVVYCLGEQDAGSEGIYSFAATTIEIYNNTIWNFNDGIERDDGTVTAKNNAVFGNVTDFDGTMTLDYNASDDGTGDNPVVPSDWVDVFEGHTSGDYRLKSGDTDLTDAGDDLTAEGFTDAIDGTERSGWSIGAFE